jgi:hypothetical protein
MNSFSFRLPVGTDVFSDLPRSAKTFLMGGLNILARIHSSQPGIIVRIAVEAAAGVEPTVSDLSAKFGLNERDSQALVGAISFLVLVLSHPNPEPVPTVVEGLVAAEVLDSAAKAAVATVLNDVNREATATAAFRRSSIATRLLPALTELNSVIDVRLDFEKDQPTVAVPVALVHIDTDTADHEIRFQMTKRQLEEVIEELRKTLSRIEAAEKWVQGRAT